MFAKYIDGVHFQLLTWASICTSPNLTHKHCANTDGSQIGLMSVISCVFLILRTRKHRHRWTP